MRIARTGAAKPFILRGLTHNGVIQIIFPISPRRHARHIASFAVQHPYKEAFPRQPPYYPHSVAGRPSCPHRNIPIHQQSLKFERFSATGNLKQSIPLEHILLHLWPCNFPFARISYIKFACLHSQGYQSDNAGNYICSSWAASFTLLPFDALGLHIWQVPRYVCIHQTFRSSGIRPPPVDLRLFGHYHPPILFPIMA